MADGAHRKPRSVPRPRYRLRSYGPWSRRVLLRGESWAWDMTIAGGIAVGIVLTPFAVHYLGAAGAAILALNLCLIVGLGTVGVRAYVRRRNRAGEPCSTCGGAMTDPACSVSPELGRGGHTFAGGVESPAQPIPMRITRLHGGRPSRRFRHE